MSLQNVLFLLFIYVNPTLQTTTTFDHSLVKHVEVGRPFSMHCDYKTGGVSMFDKLVFSQISILKDTKVIYLCGWNNEALIAPGNNLTSHWRVRCTNIVNLHHAYSSNHHTFNMTVKVDAAKASDEGSYLCRQTYHMDKSPKVHHHRLVQVAYLFVNQVYSDPSNNPCGNGWIVARPRTICLRRFNLKLNNAKAQEYCKDHFKGYLPIIQEEITDAFITGMEPRNTFWIGLSDVEVESKFKWSTGAQLDYHNWVSGTPGVDYKRHCVTKDAFFEGAWKVVDCDERHRYLCQMNIAKSSKDIDLDSEKPKWVENESGIDAIILTFLIITLIVLLSVCILIAIPQSIWSRVLGDDYKYELDEPYMEAERTSVMKSVPSSRSKPASGISSNTLKSTASDSTIGSTQTL